MVSHQLGYQWGEFDLLWCTCLFWFTIYFRWSIVKIGYTSWLKQDVWVSIPPLPLWLWPDRDISCKEIEEFHHDMVDTYRYCMITKEECLKDRIVMGSTFNSTVLFYLILLTYLCYFLLLYVAYIYSLYIYRHVRELFEKEEW